MADNKFESPTMSRLSNPKEWADVVCHTFVQVECLEKRGAPFAARITARPFGQVSITQTSSTPIFYARRPCDVKACPSDEIQIVLLDEGKLNVVQDDRRCAIGPGDMVLYDAARPFALEFEDYVGTTLKVSRSKLGHRMPAISDYTAISLPGTTRFGMLAASMIRECAKASEGEDNLNTRRLSDTLIDILAVAFESEFAPSIASTPRHRELLQRVQQGMLNHLSDPEFNIEILCKTFGIAPRTLHRLFATQGTTAMRWLWQQRLEASRRAILEKRAGSITEAALDAGFTDLSHFSRSFRQAFGVLPSELYRKQ